MSVRSDFKALEMCWPHMREIHTAYDRLLFHVIESLVDEVERLKAENAGLQRVIQSRTDHLA